MPYLHPEKIVAWVSPGKKLYICGPCGGLTKLNMKDMKIHLEKFHGLKVSGGGYAFYRDDEENEGGEAPQKQEKGVKND